jgi:uridine kinase
VTDGSRRPATLATVADAVTALRTSGSVVRVAVDGVDGAGKTVFADELADALRLRDASVVRASADGFHNPPQLRYRRGRQSPEGFFRDSYDYASLRALLLEPLSGSADRRIVRTIYDVHTESPVDQQAESASDVDVLVFDGIFAHRAELRAFWDYSVYLDVDFDVSVPRGASRGYGDPDPAAQSNRRYVEGQRLYLRACHPKQRATCVIDNNDLADAHIIRPPAPACGQ